MSLTTNNTRIVSFYKNNKHLNFESVNLSIIDLIENLSLTKNNVDSSSINDIFNKLSNHALMIASTFFRSYYNIFFLLRHITSSNPTSWLRHQLNY